MPAIFISHSSRDQKVADDITAALKHLGFEEVFLDFDKDTGIGAGADWEKTLYEKLSRCHALVLVLTPNWLTSTWCRIELAQARALGKVILPVICAPLGEQYVLPEVQAVDLLDWSAGGLERLEQRLRAIANELARGFSFDPNRPPYPGIHAFEAEDAAIYFGRDDETRAIIERLDARRTQGGARFLVVIGASGSGKSSLLKAGVLPQLSRRRRDWVVMPTMRPEKAPVETLAKAITQQLGKPDEWRTWHQTLRSAVAIDHIEELLKDLRTGDARTATVLLPVDQFEELFTVAAAPERATFLYLLASALDPARDLPVMLISTGRSDVLEGLLEAGELAHLTETYPLPPMPLDRVPRLVEGPAAMAGLNVEKGLSEAIARDVESSEALPLLAHTLWLLYRRSRDEKKLSLAEYQSLGDPERGLNPIQNSVRLVADQAIGGLKPSEAELAALRDAFVPHLVRVRLDDGKRVRQPARFSELPRESARLVRALVEARLLTTRGTGDHEQAHDAGDASVEVTHEALFKAWPTLDRWLMEEHAFLSDIERIKSAHDIWMQAPNDQQARALLGGLLLSRARDWLLKYPQRFLSRDMAALRAFIAASAAAADAEQARIAAQEAKTRRIERRLFQVAIAAAIVFAATALFSGWQYFAAERAKQEAVTQRDRAAEQRDRALISESRFLAGRANRETDAGDAVTAMLLALAALPDTAGGVERPLEVSAEMALFGGSQRRRETALLSGHAASVSSAAFSPDGSRVVTACDDNTARLWDAKTGAVLATLSGHGNIVSSAAFSPDGSRVVTASWDHTARLWDATTGAVLATLAGHGDKVNSAAYSPDGSRVVSASDDNTARLWDAKTGASLATLAGHGDKVNSAAFSPDGSRVVTASLDNTARLWDAKTGTSLATLAGHGDRVRSAAFSPDGNRVVTASWDHTARLWDGTTGAALATLAGHGDRMISAAFSPDGSRVVTASWDHTARLWNGTTGAALAMLAEHGGFVNSAAFSPDGSRVVTASSDKTARLWDAKTGAVLATLAGHGRAVNGAAFSPDGTRVVTASEDKSARLWDATTGAAPGTLAGHGAAVESAAFSPDGSRVVTASYDSTARLWDATTGAALAMLTGHAGPLESAAFSPDGSRVVTASWDHTGRLWDATTGAPLATLSGHGDQVNSAAFSPDGSRVVTASGGFSNSKDNTARLWDATTSAALATLSGHEGVVHGAAFSPDGSRVVTASWDRTARLWDAKTGAALATLSGHTSAVNSAAFSPDGSRVVTASGDNTARLWDAKTGAALATLVGHGRPVLSAVFSPDGSRVVTASWDHTARLWDGTTGAALATLSGHGNAVNSAAFSPDGSRVVTASSDKTARIWRIFSTTQNLVGNAKDVVPRCLTRQQRDDVLLGREPPAWCIEMEKWPYQTAEWKQWLADNAAGKNPLPPAD